ncbi:hypothetical protein T492DRAFT_355362 [Pavlovales sp. CCMP2436]|nr:hypothetical protein T492DRAFT_355362 [Pavlovales sp. CCMP2436]
MAQRAPPKTLQRRMMGIGYTSVEANAAIQSIGLAERVFEYDQDDVMRLCEAIEGLRERSPPTAAGAANGAGASFPTAAARAAEVPPDLSAVAWQAPEERFRPSAQVASPSSEPSAESVELHHTLCAMGYQQTDIATAIAVLSLGECTEQAIFEAVDWLDARHEVDFAEAVADSAEAHAALAVGLEAEAEEEEGERVSRLLFERLARVECGFASLPHTPLFPDSPFAVSFPPPCSSPHDGSAAGGAQPPWAHSLPASSRASSLPDSLELLPDSRNSLPDSPYDSPCAASAVGAGGPLWEGSSAGSAGLRSRYGSPFEGSAAGAGGPLWEGGSPAGSAGWSHVYGAAIGVSGMPASDNFLLCGAPVSDVPECDMRPYSPPLAYVAQEEEEEEQGVRWQQEEQQEEVEEEQEQEQEVRQRGRETVQRLVYAQQRAQEDDERKSQQAAECLHEEETRGLEKRRLREVADSKAAVALAATEAEEGETRAGGEAAGGGGGDFQAQTLAGARTQLGHRAVPTPRRTGDRV